jgi:hypothetical protein
MKSILIIALGVLGGLQALAGPVQYSVFINTSSLPAPTAGYLDYLFNGAGQSVSASIQNFTLTGGALGAAQTTGNVSGTLPATVTMDNNNTEYLNALTFGTGIQFGLLFSDTPTGGGSTFTLSLLNQAMDAALLTSNQTDGFIFRFDIDGTGQITHTTYPTETGAPSVVTITELTGVPEPGSFALVAIGAMAGLVVVRRRQQRRG